MRFLFDEMLKRLCSWCRILGLDSEFFVGKSDTQLISYAKSNDLILVTRDLQLSVRCESKGVKFILIHSDKIDEQIIQLLKETGAEISFPDKTRCASCNGELEVVSRDDVFGKVPGNVIEHHERFWRCLKCGNIYWEGSHWINIRRIFERVKAALGNNATQRSEQR